MFNWEIGVNSVKCFMNPNVAMYTAAERKIKSNFEILFAKVCKLSYFYTTFKIIEYLR